MVGESWGWKQALGLAVGKRPITDLVGALGSSGRNGGDERVRRHRK
jgi:hypothetical protein